MLYIRSTILLVLLSNLVLIRGVKTYFYNCPQFKEWDLDKNHSIPIGDFCSRDGFIKDREPEYPKCKKHPGFYDEATLSVIDSLSNFTCRIHPGKSPSDPENRECLEFAANGNSRPVDDNIDEVWTIFVPHGFMSSLENDWLKPLRDSFIQRYAKKNRRIVGIAVGWGKEELLHPPIETDYVPPNGVTSYMRMPTFIYCTERWAPIDNYPRMSSTTALVGNILGGVDRIIASDAQNNEQKRKTFCVGHSLGAQVCGFMGKSMRNEQGNPDLDGIVGIDPAGPIFMDNSQGNKLWKGDAKAVQVIHTNQDCFFCYGYAGNVGDVDFYLNGGTKQPGCTLNMCSHSFALYLLTELNQKRNICLSQGDMILMGDLESLSGGNGRQDVNTVDKNGGCYYNPNE